MRVFLGGLLAFCVFAGMTARGLALSCSPDVECAQVADSCCQEQQHTDSKQSDHHDGDSCPVEHHHHICCSHGLLISADAEQLKRLGVSNSVTMSFLHEGELAPEDPFLSSEKPPLI